MIRPARSIPWLGLALGLAALAAWLHGRRLPVTVAVGVDLPLVEGAAIDPTDRHTAELFLEEHPRSPIRLVNLFNHPNDPSRAPHDIARLKRQGVNFFITTQASSQAVPSLSQFARADALALNVSATSTLLSGRDDFFFRRIPDVALEQRALARAIEQLPGRRLLLLQDSLNEAYTDDAFATIGPELRRSGRWQIQHQRLKFSDFDPRRQQALLHGDFDALYLLAGDFNPAIGSISQLFHQLHPNAAIVLTPWARSPAIAENAGPANEHIQLLSTYPSRRHDAAVEGYFRRFRRRFGYAPYAMGMGTYQAMQLLDQAFRSGARTPEQVKRHLLSRSPHSTSFGPIRFDADGDVQARFQPIRPHDDGERDRP